MSEIVNTTIQCPFCKCEFKVTKEDIKYSKVSSSIGTYHKDHYKYFCCPICGEVVNKKLINTTYQKNSMTDKEQIKAIIKQYADKGERLFKEAYENGEHASTTGYWDGYKDCANGLLRDLEDIQEEPKFKVGDTVTVKPMSCHGNVFKGKPFKIVDIIEDNYISDDGKTYSISLQDGWKLVEQKSTEWSEEDEANLDYLIDFCNGYYNGNKPVLTESTARSLSNWLYRLKSCEIISKTNKIDNEEVEKTIHLACEFIRHRMESNGNIGGVDYAELIKRLQSLREIYTWRPSEEQICTLEKAITYVESCESNFEGSGRVLEILLEQLKKLRRK